MPKGTVTKWTWKSNVFARTERDCWTYVPAQYDKDKPAAVMVFQDGGGYVGENGQHRVPIVFDNLIQKKKMPVTIGIFLQPGTFPPEKEGEKGRSKRGWSWASVRMPHPLLKAAESSCSVTQAARWADGRRVYNRWPAFEALTRHALPEPSSAIA